MMAALARRKTACLVGIKEGVFDNCFLPFIYPHLGMAVTSCIRVPRNETAHPDHNLLILPHQHVVRSGHKR